MTASVSSSFSTCATDWRGLRDRGVAHYLGRTGRLRPDVTIWRRRPGEPPKGLVIEVKRSVNLDYLAQGFEEALVYRNEYASQLVTSPKAILVAEDGGVGKVLPEPAAWILERIRAL